jgi:hypothetical protein
VSATFVFRRAPVDARAANAAAQWGLNRLAAFGLHSTMACPARPTRLAEIHEIFGHRQAQTRYRNLGISRRKRNRNGRMQVRAVYYNHIPDIYSSIASFLGVEIVKIAGVVVRSLVEAKIGADVPIAA